MSLCAGGTENMAACCHDSTMLKVCPAADDIAAKDQAVHDNIYKYFAVRARILFNNTK